MARVATGLQRGGFGRVKVECRQSYAETVDVSTCVTCHVSRCSRLGMHDQVPPGRRDGFEGRIQEVGLLLPLDRAQIVGCVTDSDAGRRAVEGEVLRNVGRNWRTIL